MAAPTRPIDADPRRPRLMVLTAMFGLAVTVAILSFPSVKFAYFSPAFHVSLETTAGLTAALAAFLFFGRLREHRLRSSWTLVYALATSAMANVAFGVVPSVIGGSLAQDFSVWTTTLGRLVSATAFMYAASGAPARATRLRSVGLTVVAASLATIATVAVAVRTFLPFLPDGVIQAASPTLAVQPMTDVHPLIVTVQALGVMLYTAAAFGFIRRSEQSGDELMRWLAAGALLAAFSRMHYVLFPSLYSGWVYSGDILRLGFYALLLAGAVGEIRRYWQGLAVAAAADERRRIARDLHDGLAQELAYISTQTRWLRLHERTGGETAIALQAAADRALDESRRAISALTREWDEPLHVALAQAAEEVADRVGTTVRLDLEAGADVDPDVREGFLRIAREAIANAGRHSGAERVSVRLVANGRVKLQVVDDGVGFDPDTTRPDRFGLVSMRERAEALGAEFLVTSSPGRGTSVEVTL